MLVEAVACHETLAQQEKMIFESLSDTITGQETACICMDGTKIDVSVTISPLIDANRNVVERSLIIRDITEHKNLSRRCEIVRNSQEQFSTA